MQLFSPQEAQALVELERRNVVCFSLERNLHDISTVYSVLQRLVTHLICVLGYHGIHGHAHKLSGNSLAAVRFVDGQHGDVAAKWTAAMNLQLADYDTNEVVISVDSLRIICISMPFK